MIEFLIYGLCTLAAIIFTYCAGYFWTKGCIAARREEAKRILKRNVFIYQPFNERREP
jgi:hypothetical protein